MASITEKVQQIRETIFGKDVRESIATGIEEINTEVENTTSRQTTLETNMNNLATELNEAEDTRVLNEDSRINAEADRQLAEQNRVTEFQEIVNIYETANHDNVNIELVQARNGEVNLDTRLDKIDNKIGDLSTLGVASTVEKFNEVDASLADIVQQADDLEINKAEKTALNTTNNNVALKADKSYVDTQIQSVVSGSPKFVYATLSALQTAHPTGNSFIYVVTADGNWYYWNGSAWTAGGVYQSTGIANDSVTKTKLKNNLSNELFSWGSLTLNGTVATLTGSGNNMVFQSKITGKYLLIPGVSSYNYALTNDEVLILNWDTDVDLATATTAVFTTKTLTALKSAGGLLRNEHLILGLNSGKYFSSIAEFSSILTGEFNSYVGSAVRGQIDMGFNNLLTNADFSSGITGWSKYQSNIAVNNKICTVTLTGVSPSLYQSGKVALTGDKIFIHFKAKTSISNRNFVAFVSGANTLVLPTIADTWQSYNAIVTSPVDTPSIDIKMLNGAIGENYQIKEVFAMNLTSVFGQKKEPSLSNMYSLMNDLPYTFASGIKTNSLIRFLYDSTLTYNKSKLFYTVTKTGGDFTSINEALNNISDSAESPATLLIMPGIYIESVSLLGRYVSLIGVNKETCILKTFTNDYHNPPLDLCTNSNVYNLTIIADDDGVSTPPNGVNNLSAYAIHFDIASREGALTIEQLSGKSVVENCNLISKHNNALGVGTVSNQHLIIKNCELYSDATYTARIHNQVADGGINQNVTMENCTIINGGSYAPLALRDNNRNDTDCTFTFRNIVAYSEVDGFTTVLDVSHAPMVAGAIVGKVMLGKGSYGNNISALNKPSYS